MMNLPKEPMSEEDRVPLVATRRESDEQPGRRQRGRTEKLAVVLSVAVAVLCVYLGIIKKRQEHQRHHYSSSNPKPIFVEEINPGVGPIGAISVQRAPFVPAATKEEDERLPPPLKLEPARNPRDMLDNLRTARQHLEQQLTVEYGPFYFERIFHEPRRAGAASYSRGRTIYQPAAQGLSWERLKSKLMQKLLQVQLVSNNEKEEEEATEAIIPFVWAVGGESNAAGHGNLATEAITAYLDRAVSTAFAAVGLRFLSRNYGMRGTSSAPETALCQKEIFGQDVDVLVWDFGPADQAATEKLSLFFSRAGVNAAGGGGGSSRPVCIANRVGRRYFSERKQAMADLEERGLASFYMSELVLDRALEGIPDSFGLSPLQRQQLPKNVRDLRCRETIEAGHEQCWDAKYNVTVCEDRPGRVSWHSGWKQNAILGNLAAFFLLEAMEDALTEMVGSEIDPSAFFNELQDVEDDDFERFRTAAVPDYFELMLDKSDRDGLDISLLVQGHNVCHTARLPAEIRYKGILTESPPTDDSLFYEKGMLQEEADSTVNSEGRMRLVYSKDDHDQVECNHTLTLDQSDYFYTTTAEDWNMIVLPNDTELREYGNGEPLQGILAICFAACPYNKCPRRNMDLEAFEEKLFEMSVNGMAVFKLVDFGGCVLLQNDEGYQWKPNEDGKFVFRARVLQPDSALRIGSFILW